MYFLYRELQRRLVSRTRLGLWLLTATLCALSGPFQTLKIFSLAENALFWMLSVGLIIVWANFLDIGFHTLLPERPYYQRVLLQGMVFAPPTGLYAYGTALLYAQPDIIPDPHYLNYLLQAYSLYVVVVLSIYAVQPGAPESSATSEDGNPLINRLRPELGRTVLRITSDNHYVEVQTSCGTQRLLMRFSDALAALEDQNGVRVHRSHWVSARAVSGVVRKDGKVCLVLHDGREIPVSRTYRAAAEKAGLI